MNPSCRSSWLQLFSRLVLPKPRARLGAGRLALLAVAPGPAATAQPAGAAAGGAAWPLLSGQSGERTPHEAFYFYHYEQLHAVRSDPWKLYVPLERQRLGSSAPLKMVNSPPHLYNFVDDQAESRDVAANHSNIVARLLKLAAHARKEIGDLDIPGRDERPAGWVFQPQTQQLPAKH